MMRKTSVILLSAATGAALTLFVTQPRAVLMGSSARAAASDTYRQLNLFGDVFERVRTDYVEKPNDSKLVESAISGMLQGLDPHSSYMDAKSFRDMTVQTRGPVNTKIKLKVIRKGQDKPLEITLMRENIRVRPVRARIEQDDIAYIRV